MRSVHLATPLPSNRSRSPFQGVTGVTGPLLLVASVGPRKGLEKNRPPSHASFSALARSPAHPAFAFLGDHCRNRFRVGVGAGGVRDLGITAGSADSRLQVPRERSDAHALDHRN